MPLQQSPLRSWCWSAGLVAVCIGLAGCGEPAERLVPVSGKVTVKGKPLPSGMVVFQPDAEKGNKTQQEPRGSIEEGAAYRLATGDRDGAPPGWYKVAVFALKTPSPESGMQPPEWLANQRFSDARTSGLAVHVVENPAPGAYDFDLEP